LTLASPSFGATLGPRLTATLAILDNASAVQFSSPLLSITEAGIAVLRVERSGPVGLPGIATVHFQTVDGSATAGPCTVVGNDYVAKSGNLTFGPGVAALTINVQTCSNTIDDGDRTFTVDLSMLPGGTPLGVQPTATVTIRDNDVAGTVQFSQSFYTVSEAAAAATIVVTRTGGTASGVTVDYQTTDVTATGGATALPGVDYKTTSGTLSFPAGVTSRTFTVPVFADTAVEGNETVLLSLSPPTGGATLGPRSTATLTIVDND
jgi:hypothetical protein